ncbi:MULTISPECIES: lysine N(6)-hydroxylase/L-ornithine N(5)-oxygenase family protein [Rhodococcus]|uniref:L-lysine N6-monooxygenase MbtG n=1 Tax=Rhodococcus opacus TaxID=37919 RepID=A0A076EEF8_RHOOP|nr:SidA/IucD/PvdA family monooxygenase [Rhodococcus opacus]AII04026.1 L-lysine 6-monooxygenase [Rhodococcus opacus]
MLEHLDLVGIGAGPSNLSVAALSAPIGRLRCKFLDRQPTQRWYPGLMLSAAVLQVSHLKDLVTLVDPTSRYTFLNFLARTGRLHRFASLHTPLIARREYESYLRWVSDQLDEVQFGCAVEEVTFDGQAFRVESTRGAYAAQHLSIGVGPRPYVPEVATGKLGEDVFHSSDFGYHTDSLAGRDVVVVGGGQSGAEVVEHLLQLSGRDAVGSLTWASRRIGFQPLDESPFTNEWFHPDYVRYFHGLSQSRRSQLLDAQQLASDGISKGLLESIYRRLYHNDFVDSDRIRTTLLPGREVTGLCRGPGGRGWRMSLTHIDTGEIDSVGADIVVLATGYHFPLPEFLHPLGGRIARTNCGLPQLAADYSVSWAGPAGNKMFFLNAGKLSHGIADPNLSLASWRAATVLNTITETPLYPDLRSSTCSWDVADRAATHPPVDSGVDLLTESSRP